MTETENTQTPRTFQARDLSAAHLAGLDALSLRLETLAQETRVKIERVCNEDGLSEEYRENQRLGALDGAETIEELCKQIALVLDGATWALPRD